MFAVGHNLVGEPAGLSAIALEIGQVDDLAAREPDGPIVDLDGRGDAAFVQTQRDIAIPGAAALDAGQDVDHAALVAVRSAEAVRGGAAGRQVQTEKGERQERAAPAAAEERRSSA